MKIAIIGYSGSGKSTLARLLGDHYKIPVLFLDRIQFLPNWRERDKDEGRALVSEFMKNTSWVIDGNYTGFYQRERLELADKIIFMNFPRRVSLYRAIKRYFQYKGKSRESMTEGCNEKIDIQFVWWILHKGRTKMVRTHYKDITKEFSNKIIILRNKSEVENFLNEIYK